MKGYLLLITPLLLVTAILISLNIFFQQSLQMEIAEDFNTQQLILAQTISTDIKEYLAYMKEEAVSLSHIASKMDIQSKQEFEWLKFDVIGIKGLVKPDIGILRDDGKVIFYDGDRDVLNQISKQLVNKAKSTPFGRSALIETPEILYFISPANNSGRIIFLSVNSLVLANHFLSNIQSNRKGNTWILTGNGNLLYHPTQPGMAGRNIYSTDNTCFQCHRSFDYEKVVIEGKANSKGKGIDPSGDERLIAYSKVDVDDISWAIFLSANYSDVMHITEKSMKLYSYLILTILLTTIFVSTALFTFNKKRLMAKELEMRQENMNRYAKDLEEQVNEKTSRIVREREKLSTILNAIGGGIILINKQGKILWANEMIKEIFKTEVAGKYCEELWTDCDISSTYAKDNVETTIISLKNKKFLQMITAPVKDEHGKVYRYIRLIQDITEMKKMEEQIINSEKLASIGRLAAGIAHEIGNPLTSIFSYIQILRELEDDKFKKESIETIYFHIKRISEILKQLSGFSKMPAVELQACQVNEVIENSTRLIQYDKQAQGIVIVKELSDSLPDITVDLNQLSQVFINLILNAVDAMPDGGRLLLRSYVEDNNIVIEFDDTGVGIPRENLFIIFDPFYTTKEKGTGLGLAVSYNIIKKMKGTLTVDSEPGKGSVFKITLPLSDVEGENI